MDVTAKDESSRVSATTDSRGNYVFHNLAVDPWGCVAGTDQTLQTAALKPGAATTLDIAACTSGCPKFKFHQGTVIHRLTAYLLFWLPNGHIFEPDGSSSRFEHLMEQYFQDVGGTPFYNILSQYYDDQGGPVRNVVTLGGSFVDTQPYPQAGTVSDPLLDGDIVHEINRVLDRRTARGSPTTTTWSSSLPASTCRSVRARRPTMAARLPITPRLTSAPITRIPSTTISSTPIFPS